MADEVIQEVRRVRHEISSRCGHDVHRVATYYRAFQAELKRAGTHRFLQPDQAGDSVASKADAHNPVGTQEHPPAR